MQFNASIGESHIFRLQQAVLLYGPNIHQCDFATVHHVRYATEDATPTLGEARLLTQDFLRDLVKCLSRAKGVEIFPENLLCHTEVMTGWWTPEHDRPLFFHTDTELAHLTGKTFPVPALVWRVHNGRLSVRALAQDLRPNATTSLRLAPFWNVYLDGTVCHGSMRVPTEHSVTDLKLWEKAFFGSNFSHTIRDEMCAHPGGAAGLWASLVGSEGPFPVQYLQPAKQTLEEFFSNAK
jgi:PRTRC genetic system protein B